MRYCELEETTIWFNHSSIHPLTYLLGDIISRDGIHGGAGFMSYYLLLI